MEEDITVIRDPKTFYFGFDWPKVVGKNFIFSFIFSNSL